MVPSSDCVLLCWNSQHYQIVVWFVFRMLCLSAYVMVITHFLSTSGVRSLTRPRIWWHACLWLILVAASQRRMFSIILGSRTVSRSANKCYCQLPNGKMTKKDPTFVILCSNGDDSFLYHTARNSQNFIEIVWRFHTRSCQFTQSTCLISIIVVSVEWCMVNWCIGLTINNWGVLV